MSLDHPEQHSFESFIVVWLDTNLNESNTDLRDATNHLRCIVNSIKRFVHVNDCLDYFNGNRQEKIYMIVSDAMGQQLVPGIQDISHLFAIYVFCIDEKTDEQWIKEYKKV
jgi:hypothetical protein